MANNNKGWDVFKNRTSHYLKYVPPGQVVLYFLDGKPYYKIGNTITQMGAGGGSDGGGDGGDNTFRIDVKQTGNSIVATGVNGTAPYEYRLDNLNPTTWYASGIFANITEGEHTVYVREKNNPTKVVSQKFNVTNGDLSLGKPVLQARAIGKSTLLTWTYSGRVPSVFQIYRATKGGPRELVASVSGTERTWQDGTSSPRTEYTYDIVPIDAQSSGIASDPVTIVTGSDDLATPRLNGVVSGDDVKLTISVDTARMKSILLKRKKEPAGAFELLKEIDATGNLTYQDNDLSAGTYTYTGQGVGFNASELGQVSVGLTLEIKNQNPDQIQIPPDFTVTQVADGRLRVKITGRTDSRRYVASVSIGDYYAGGKAIYGNYNLYSQNGEFDIIHSTAGLVSNTVLYIYVADYAYQGRANEAVYLFTYYAPDTGNPGGGGGSGDFSIPTDVRTDDPGMLYLSTTKARYGIYITWGGTIARINHLSDVNDSNFLNDPTNIVNCADLGREVQWALYGWPLAEGEFKPGGQSPNNAWKTIGWDPIQAGDFCAPSKVEQWKMWPDGKKLYVRTRPMHWGYCNSRADCFVDTFYVVNGVALEIYNFLTNQRGDYFKNLPRGQDWAGGFIRGDYTNGITYFGNQPATGLPVTEFSLNAPPMDQVEAANDGAFQYYSSEGWAALKSPQEGDQKLFGVWSPTTMFSNSVVGQFNKKELPSQGACVTLGNHIFLEKMDRNIKYAWNAAYVVGNISDIRNYALGRRGEMFKPDWNFAVDRQRWWTQGAYENGQESSYPFNGYWEVKYDYEWSNFCSPEFAINMNDYDTAELFLTTTGTSSNSCGFNIHKKLDNGKRFNGAFTDCTYNFPTINDGQMRRYEVSLGTNPAWGNGTGLRMYLDFGGNKELGRLVRLHKIRLYKK